MWHILSGALYRLTGDEKSKNRNLLAAASLASRFVLGGNYIRAWNDASSKGWPQRPVTNWTIIDCMMNLPILYWASEHIGDDWLPRIDFRAPSEPVYYDTSAGCCAACGMIEIAKALPEDEGGVYMHAAIKMLRAIAEKFADFDPETDEMILGGSTRYPVPGKYTMEQSGVHIHLVYSDFYFIEGILKLLGSEFNP